MMTRFQKIFLCLILIGLLPSLSLQARPHVKASGAAWESIQLLKQQDAVREVQDLLFQRRYESAELKMAQFIQRWPDDIVGDFGMMILYQTQNFENFYHRFDKQYRRWHEKGRKKAIRILKDSRSDPWHLFIASGVLSVSGLYRLNQDQTFGALRDGSMAVNAMKKALKKDPTWLDPLFGLGMYDYWRSVFTKRWKFLPFFPDRRERGIKNVKKATTEGTFVNELARSSLAYIYYTEEKYEKALKINGALVKKYPNNVIIHLLQGHILAGLKKYEKALKNYHWVQKTDPQLTKVNFYIARLYFEKAKERQKALKKKHKTKRLIFVEDFEKVLPWIERYLQSESGASDRWKAVAYSLWGEALYQLRAWDDAKAKFKLALRNDYSLYLPKKRLKMINRKQH